MALAEWKENAPPLATLRRLWGEVAAAPNVSEALLPIQEAWRSASDDESRWAWALLFGPSISDRVGTSRHRREALKSLGNSVVPQCAAVIGKAILEAEVMPVFREEV
jgi:hypothetical protein